MLQLQPLLHMHQRTAVPLRMPQSFASADVHLLRPWTKMHQCNAANCGWDTITKAWPAELGVQPRTRCTSRGSGCLPPRHTNNGGEGLR